MTAATTSPASGGPEPLCYGYRELCKVIGLGRRTIERMVSMRRFPQPRKVGIRTVFVAAEVRAWLQALPAREC